MIAAYVMKVVMASVIFLMLGVGLNTAFGQVIAVARQVRLIGIGVLANFIVVPALIYLSLVWLPLSPEVKIGIMLMAAAPIAPMAPPFVGMARGNVAYAVGLMTIVALLSVPLTPLILDFALPKSTEGVALDPMQIIKTLLIAQLIPISVGMTIRQVSPKWAERLLKFVPKIGQIGLIIGVGLLLAKDTRQILSIGILPHLVMALMVIGSLFIGDWMLIGETDDNRRSLAVSTAIRNVPLAFLIAGENFPDTVVAPVTLLFGVFTMVLSIGYGKMMARSDA
ncbi:MAG: bile acid:sodium symporter [Anaerolineales bacterium]|jgi:BASS family bile acid:Na+ symporter|nr:bile acid:sodium symporter [Anaerolineales bacterium]